VLLGECVEHGLIPLAEIGCAVVCQGETDLFVFRETRALDGNDLGAIGFDDADILDASGFSAFDGAVAGEDAVVLVNDDGACGTVALKGLFDEFSGTVGAPTGVFLVWEAFLWSERSELIEVTDLNRL
jgi:hypothetical protein